MPGTSVIDVKDAPLRMIANLEAQLANQRREIERLKLMVALQRIELEQLREVR